MPIAHWSCAASGWFPVSRTASAWGDRGNDVSGIAKGGQGIKMAPSQKLELTASSTACAMRVLPTPPGPVRVSKETAGSRISEQTSAHRCFRPMRGVRSADDGETGRVGAAIVA